MYTPPVHVTIMCLNLLYLFLFLACYLAVLQMLYHLATVITIAAIAASLARSPARKGGI